MMRGAKPQNLDPHDETVADQPPAEQRMRELPDGDRSRTSSGGEAAELAAVGPTGPGGVLPRRWMYRYGVIVVWGIEIAIFGALEPHSFLTLGNFQLMASSQASLIVLALSVVPTLVVGEFDLSVASVMGLSATLVGQLNGVDHWTLALALAIAIAASVVVGLVNAFLTVYVGLQGIIVTLGMGTLLLGIAIEVSNSLTISGVSQALSNAVNMPVLGISLAFYFALLLTAGLWYVIRYTPVGRQITFTGFNREVARLSGVNVSRIRVGSFVATSTLAGIAGVIMIGVAGGLDPTTVQTLLLPAFAAAFLGTTMFEPGRVNAVGSCVALLFLTTGITGLELLGLQNWIQYVFYGAAMIVAVTVSRLFYLQSQRKPGGPGVGMVNQLLELRRRKR